MRWTTLLSGRHDDAGHQDSILNSDATRLRLDSPYCTVYPVRAQSREARDRECAGNVPSYHHFLAESKSSIRVGQAVTTAQGQKLSLLATGTGHYTPQRDAARGRNLFQDLPNNNVWGRRLLTACRCGGQNGPANRIYESYQVSILPQHWVQFRSWASGTTLLRGRDGDRGPPNSSSHSICEN